MLPQQVVSPEVLLSNSGWLASGKTEADVGHDLKLNGFDRAALYDANARLQLHYAFAHILPRYAMEAEWCAKHPSRQSAREPSSFAEPGVGPLSSGGYVGRFMFGDHFFMFTLAGDYMFIGESRAVTMMELLLAMWQDRVIALDERDRSSPFTFRQIYSELAVQARVIASMLMKGVGTGRPLEDADREEDRECVFCPNPNPLPIKQGFNAQLFEPKVVLGFGFAHKDEGLVRGPKEFSFVDVDFTENGREANMHDVRFGALSADHSWFRSPTTRSNVTKEFGESVGSVRSWWGVVNDQPE
jgi:hypothetical protein